MLSLEKKTDVDSTANNPTAIAYITEIQKNNKISKRSNEKWKYELPKNHLLYLEYYFLKKPIYEIYYPSKKRTKFRNFKLFLIYLKYGGVFLPIKKIWKRLVE